MVSDRRMVRVVSCSGSFYAQGVKANVLFFDRKPGASEPWTRTVEDILGDLEQRVAKNALEETS